MSQVNITTNTSKVEVNTTNNQIVVTNPVNPNTVSITQPVTTVVEVITAGPQGPPGLIPSTGSFVTTSSFNAFTSSYNTGSFTGSFTGSLFGTSSYAASIGTLNQNVNITGSLNISGSITATGNQTTVGYLLVGSGSANNTPNYGVAPNVVVGMNAGTAGAVLELRNTSQSILAGNTLGTIQFTADGSGGVYSSTQIRSTVTTGPGSGASGGGNLLFLTAPSTSGGIIERMRINSSGNVGIGKTNPSTALDVSGSVSVTGSLLVAGNILPDTDNTRSIGTGTQGLNLIWTRTVRSNSTLGFYPGGVLAATITTGGNLLLGTTTDSGFKLDVNGTSRHTGDTTITGSLLVTGSTTVAGNIVPSVNGTYDLGAPSFNFTRVRAQNVVSNGSLSLYSGGNLGLTVASSANILIGTATDNSIDRLQVVGSARITDGLTLSGSLLVTGSTTVAGNIMPSAHNLYSLGTNGTRFKDGYFNGTLVGVNFYASNLSFASTDLNIYNSTGNALGKWSGIGNLILQSGSATVPTDDGINRLQVSGSARITNGLTVTGSLLVTGSTTVAGNIVPVTDIAYDLGTTSKRFNNVRGFKSEFTYYYSPSSTESYFGSSTNSAINFPINNLVYGRFVATTGNFLLQNGGTIPSFSDNGYRLQIRASTGSLSGSLYADGFVNFTGTISSSIQPANNPSASLMVIGGTTIQSSSILNSSAVQINPIMSASANSQTLIGLDINPTFNTTGFTNTNNFGLRVSSGTGMQTAIITGYPNLRLTTQTPSTFIGFYLNQTSTEIGRFAATTGNLLLGTPTDVASSKLTVNSTTQGFLPPRMTNAERLLISSPAVGLMVYCTDAVEGVYVNKSTGWTFIG